MAGEEEMAAGSADAVDNSTDAQARGMESGGVEASSSSDDDSQSSSETETQMPDEVPNTQVDAAKAPRATTEARIANHDEEAKSGSLDLVYSSDDSMEDISSDADDACNPLLMGVVPPSKTVDVQVNTLVHSRRRNYLYFQQWKGKLNGKAAHTRLRLALEELLPRLIGARDYAGAAKVLRVMYHRFEVTPALCVEASLEILRRQPDYRNDLLSYYESALVAQRIDNMSILKEMWFFHIVHGEFYEAYHLYQDRILQMSGADEDARLLANFGILCYWLMFIESRELREMLKGDEVDDEEEDEMETTLNENFDASGSIESVIESNYLFKTPIGVASLYQHANNSLRRAVALNPSSAMFVEHYVQLLVLVGDIQPACDYLEAFYNMNPGDPHGPRMLSSFLATYYPESVDAQVAVFSRWMKNDPASSYPLEKMLEFSSAGAVSSFVLTKVLVEALDTCGSDSYVAENPEMALTLWRNLAELLTAMDEDEFMLDQADRWDQETIADVGAQRLWWKRVYFARPNTADEVAAISKCDSTFMEVCIYRAAVADRLFPGHISIANALSSAMASSGMTYSREHLRLFKSFFPSPLSPVLDSKGHRSFSGMAFMHVVVDTDDKDANRVLPIFKGSSDTLHVIDRKSVVEIEPPGDQATVVATRTGEAEGVDPQFVEELYDALEFEVGSNNQRPHRKRKADAMLSSAEPIAIPAYITMVEEEVYNNPTAIVSHIYSALYQKLRRSDMLLPTSRTVTYCVNYFRARLKKNRELYGHSGLMMRYETFITMYVHRQRAKGVFEVTTNTVKAAIQEMKRVLPSPHPHFPDEELVKETMRTKLGILVRQRRLRLMEMKEMMKWLLKQLVYVDEKNFIEVVYSACMQNGLLGVVTRVDVARLLQNILPLHYYAVLQDMQPRHMKMLTSSRLRKLYNTPEEIYEKAMEYKSRPTIEEIKALLWVERYEALYGPIADFDEESDSESDSSSESSSESSSSSDSDSSDTDG